MKLNIKKNYLFNFFYIAFIFLLSIDSFRNPLKSQRILGFSAYKLIIPLLILQLVLNWKYNIKLFPKISKILFKIIFPILILITIVFSILDTVVSPNFVYTLTNFHQQGLGNLSLYLGLSLFFNKSNRYWQKNIKNIIFYIPFILIILLLITKLWPGDVFEIMILEDHIIENFQFIVLFIGGVVSLFFALKFRVKNKSLYYFFLITFFCLFLISGDEISWGQRIFNFKTIDAIKPYNLQNENTIHNLDFFDHFVRIGYILFSLFGVFSKSIAKLVSENKSYVNYLPDNIFLGYFIFPAIYNVLEYFSFNNSIKGWAEPMELFLYCGLVFFIIYQGYLRYKKYYKNTINV